MAEVLFRAKLQRDDPKERWGFCLQGGADCKRPLKLLQVQAESYAAKGGLLPGDIVVKLAGQSALGMTHSQAQKTIIGAGNTLEIIVERSEELASPVYAPADMVFPEQRHEQTAITTSKETTSSRSNERTNGPLLKAPEVISDSSEEPFPVKTILKTPTVTNNHKIKLAGKTVKFLDESPPRRNRRPSPSPIRRSRPAYRGRKRSSSAPTLYTRVRITGRDQSPSAKPKYERQVSVISGADSPTRETPAESETKDRIAIIPPLTKAGEGAGMAFDNSAESSKTAETKADSCETAVNSTEPPGAAETSDGGGCPLRRSRADTARRADIYRQGLAEKRGQEEVPRQESEQRNAQDDICAKELEKDSQDDIDKHESAETKAHEMGTQTPDSLISPADMEMSLSPSGIPIAVKHHTTSLAADIMVNHPNLLSEAHATTTVPHIPVIIHPHFTQQHFVLSPLMTQNPMGLGISSPPDRNTPSPVRTKSPSPTPQSPVHTVTVAPEVADLPMPAVKSIVQDLNRRLEALAAQQPELTKPLTPRELGVSYIRKDVSSPSSSSSEESDTSSDLGRKSNKDNPQPVLQKPGPAQSPPLQKLYDVNSSSPLSSPVSKKKKVPTATLR